MQRLLFTLGLGSVSLRAGSPSGDGAETLIAIVDDHSANVNKRSAAAELKPRHDAASNTFNMIHKIYKN